MRYASDDPRWQMAIKAKHEYPSHCQRLLRGDESALRYLGPQLGFNRDGDNYEAIRYMIAYMYS